MWKRLIVIILAVIIIFAPTWPAAADQQSDLQDQINQLRQKIADAQSQEKTLSSQIDLINNQIALTKVQIQQTQDKLDRLNNDISSVSGKINVIQDSLAHASVVLANRIRETYIAGRTDPITYLLLSANFDDFFQRFDYLRIVQKHDKELMTQMALTQKNYNDQKDLLVDKKKQVEELSAQLKAEKNLLDQQNRDKQQLLAVTQNSEATYQQLLAQAQAELAAFQGFVTSQGGASLLSNQTKCNDWGCYYNQRDSQWGAMALNHTGYTLANSGCLVTSMAMVATHYGHKDINPISINSNPDNFAVYYPAYLNKSITANGVNMNRQSISYSQIDSELSAGHPVVVGIGAGPSHFVVLVSGSNGDYKMNDPFVENGQEISFTSHYSLGSMTEIDKVTM
ncbi:MAG: hypothetical protein M1484_00150 [Patescibacteria group bacterium]|nr:hypothetical protein [Patescibacteria group bacterium]